MSQKNENVHVVTTRVRMLIFKKQSISIFKNSISIFGRCPCILRPMTRRPISLSTTMGTTT